MLSNMLTMESDGDLGYVDGDILIMRINCLAYMQIFCTLKGKKINDCCRQKITKDINT